IVEPALTRFAAIALIQDWVSSFPCLVMSSEPQKKGGAENYLGPLQAANHSNHFALSNSCCMVIICLMWRF
ncbi:MAG: hypothetical protein LUP91_05185, partial [Methylococcaceae bacterium]|nr:hypothetical protein [Methylococcaceae bacterium]